MKQGVNKLQMEIKKEEIRDLLWNRLVFPGIIPDSDNASDGNATAGPQPVHVSGSIFFYGFLLI